MVARGPFDAAAEHDLMADRGVRVLVTKDSGGAGTAAKLDAAATLGVQVVMITRPADPDGIPRLTDTDAAIRWASAALTAGPARPRPR